MSGKTSWTRRSVPWVTTSDRASHGRAPPCEKHLPRRHNPRARRSFLRAELQIERTRRGASLSYRPLAVFSGWHRGTSGENVAFLAAGRYHSARKLTSVWRCRDESRDEDAGSPRVQVAGPRRRVDRRRTFLRPPRHRNHTS